MNNPLFPTSSEPSDNGYVLPPKETPQLETHLNRETAAELIRAKVAKLYEKEPDAGRELTEAEAARNRSPHQEFMHQLRTSGKDLATIQTEWHNYYIGLSDSEKRQVWQEFYESNTSTRLSPEPAEQPEQLATHKHEAARPARERPKPPAADDRRPADIRAVIRRKVSAGGKLQARHHLQSLLFGLSLGAVALLIFLFGFFNQIIIAPFIQPSRHAQATPIILDPGSVAPTKDPEVIIPKINVEIPVDYSQTSTDETVIENALEDGVVHYPTTTLPGQDGNAAFFGHSSNNIFSPGKYKFAFVLLHELVPGDTFYLTKDGRVYVYKVFSKTIVEPNQVSVLDPVPGHKATATLITCDPPGTSWRRLVVVGDQISPDPGGNSQPAANMVTTAPAPVTLPSEGPTLWSRWWGTGYGKLITVVAAVLIAAGFARIVRRPLRY